MSDYVFRASISRGVVIFVISFFASTVVGQVVSVTNLASIGRSVQRSTITQYKDELVFAVGVDDTLQREIWSFDGIEARRIADGFVGESEIAVDEFTEFQGRLYFSGNRGDVGKELYRYDGNSVSLAVDIETGVESSFPVNFHTHNNALYFSAKTGDSFNSLWRYDGSEAQRIAQFDDPRASVVTGATFQGDLYFGADDATAGMELWRYDGRDVEMVADINSGPGDSYPREFAVVEDALYFKATTPNLGQEIWKYDGEATSLVADVNPGNVSSDPRHLTEVNGELIFSAVSQRVRSVFISDGDDLEKIVGGGGPIPIGDELYTIRGRREGGTEINDLHDLDGNFYRSTVESAGPFVTFQGTLFFSCSCDERELYMVAADGDVNVDGAVTVTDFLTLVENFGQDGNWKLGDFDRDGVVLFDDFLKQSKNFGGAPIKKSISAIPEPNAGMLMLVGLAVGAACRRRRPN